MVAEGIYISRESPRIPKNQSTLIVCMYAYASKHHFMTGLLGHRDDWPYELREGRESIDHLSDGCMSIRLSSQSQSPITWAILSSRLSGARTQGLWGVVQAALTPTSTFLPTYAAPRCTWTARCNWQTTPYTPTITPFTSLLPACATHTAIATAHLRLF